MLIACRSNTSRQLHRTKASGHIPEGGSLRDDNNGVEERCGSQTPCLEELASQPDNIARDRERKREREEERRNESKDDDGCQKNMQFS